MRYCSILKINLRKIKILLLITTLSCLFFYWIIELFGIISDPNKILCEYPIGNKVRSLKINDGDIIFQIENKRGWNNVDINIMLKGYTRPEKFLKNDQKLIIINRGEYAVYLYFDLKDILVDKEIVGS